MAQENQTIQGDVKTILQLDAKFHYDNLAEVRAVHDKIVQKGMLRSPMGKRYVKRLEQLLGGTKPNTCTLCGGALNRTGMICSGCISKYANAGGTGVGTQQNTGASAASAIPISKNKKSLIIGISVLVVAFLLIASIGLGTIFMFLTIAAACVLAYKAAKKQDKKMSVIAVAVFGVLAIVFSGSGGKDVIGAIGMTEAQLKNEFGMPTRHEGTFYYYEDNTVDASVVGGTCNTIGLYGEKYNILGISVGDKRSKAESVLEKNGFSKRDDYSEFITSGSNIIYKNSQYTIDIVYDGADRVRSISAGRAGGY